MASSIMNQPHLTRSNLHVNCDLLRLCSFNCRSVKNCAPVIRELCDAHDIVLLQEHWLLPNELNFLNSIHKDFLSIGLSAVDLTTDILVGRPYGGTAILFRNNIFSRCSVIESDSSRITGLEVNVGIGSVLILCVYMPCDYGDNDSLENYIECLCELHACIANSDAPHIVLAGNFNCSTGSRFYNEFIEFVTDNNLIMSDVARLNNVQTYVSDDGLRKSWIDHICNAFIDDLVTNIKVLRVIVSHHKPLSCSINITRNHDAADPVSSDDRHMPLWDKCDTYTLSCYSN